MPLTFHPDRGAILICDLSTGFRPPEMVKVRPVVVISPRRRRGSGLVNVVPLSSTAPTQPEPWHYCLPAGIYPPARAPMWAKCDMVSTVAFDRLDRVKSRDTKGNRSYQIYQIGTVHLGEVLACVRAALDFN